MNSYTRLTLRGGAFKTANGPYGSSRGNRVLQAKRVHGPSAQALLCIAFNAERCHCGSEATVSRTKPNGTIVRECLACATDNLPTYLSMHDDGTGMCPRGLRADW